MSKHERIVLITGGGSGIGLACARHFLAAGDRVYLAGRREETLRMAQDELRDTGTVRVHAIDLRDPQAANELVATVWKETGALDVLVNNAGVFLPAGLLKADEENASAQLETNLLAPWRLLKAAATRSIEAGRGLQVTNVLSVAALRAFPGTGWYAASKAGLKALMDAARGELRGKGVRITNVYPGMTETPIWQQRMEDTSALMDADTVGRHIFEASATDQRLLVEDLVLRPINGDN